MIIIGEAKIGRGVIANFPSEMLCAARSGGPHPAAAGLVCNLELPKKKQSAGNGRNSRQGAGSQRSPVQGKQWRSGAGPLGDAGSSQHPFPRASRQEMLDASRQEIAGCSPHPFPRVSRQEMLDNRSIPSRGQAGRTHGSFSPGTKGSWGSLPPSVQGTPGSTVLAGNGGWNMAPCQRVRLKCSGSHAATSSCHLLSVQN